MITTTLNRIWACDPCDEGKARAFAAAGKTEPDDEPIPFAAIVDAVGLDYALWCCRAEPEHAREWRLFAVWCARRVQHLMFDQRTIDALDVAERYANGAATQAELVAAREAARDAWAAAKDAAVAAAVAAAWAAAGDAAGDAAEDAAWDAWAAAGAAAGDAAWAAAGDAAGDAAEDAAEDAAWDAWAAAGAAAGDMQRAAFIQLVTDGTLP